MPRGLRIGFGQTPLTLQAATGKYGMMASGQKGNYVQGPIQVRQSNWMSLSTYNFQPYNVTLNGVQTGSVLYVVTAWPNDAGTTQPFQNWIVYDNFGGSGNPYTFLGQRDDNAPVDSESYAHYYTKNVGAGDYTVSFFDTNAFESGRLQYIGVTVYEIINADTTAPLAGHSEAGPTSHAGTATDSLTGSVTTSAAPALVIASCGSNAGTAPSAAPTAGTGWTDLGSQWNFLGDSEKWIRSQSKRVTSSGAQGTTFTPTGTDVYMTMMAAFKEGS